MRTATWQTTAIAGAASYALGSLSPAAAAARLRGVDLRGSGSGNPGATNAARAMGVPVGVVVGGLDVAKGYAAVAYFSQYGAPAGHVAGVAAVLGHVTSPLLRGRGGKGVATSLGAVLAIEPIWAVPVLAGFGTTVALTREVGIGSVIGSLTLVPASLVVWDGWAGVGFAVGMSALVVHRHRRNIRAFAARQGWIELPRPAEEDVVAAAAAAAGVGGGRGVSLGPVVGVPH